MTRWNDAGFSLIEALVAMSVLALGAVALLTATEGYTARITDITDRTTARWVAENRLAELRLGLGIDSDAVLMLGSLWKTDVTLTASSQPGLEQISVAVGADQGNTFLVVLDGYRDTGAQVNGDTP